LTASPAQAAHADKLLPALQAYRGELLPGFYDEWVIRERERLAALFDDRIACLLQLLLAEQRWRETIDWAEQWIAQGHTPEPAYQALIRAHAALGNPAAALTAYERCSEALDRELGIPPSAETVALADAIRTSPLTPSTGAEDRIHNPQFPPPPTPPIPSNLPASTTPLIGRERELAHLLSLLTDPAHRLVTILGPGGMGKSRLALAAASAAVEHFPDGVFLVEMVSLDSADEIPRSIGDALGYPFQTDPRPPRQQLLDYLGRRKLLLVLDNFEHLLGGAELLIAQLEAAPGLHLLVTSRERLHLHTETLFRLNGLDYPANGKSGGENFPFAGAQLFLQCAQRVRREFTPEEGSWSAILRICRQVDGMPLGIILAASWVEHLSPAEIADEIAANVAFLGQDLRDLDPRHRTMEAVFAQSWRRLSDEERLALMGLSIFAGGFDREVAQAVAGAGLPVLSRLVDKALLWLVGEGRYDLHELIRQLARQKLAESGQGESLRGLHSRYFLGLAARQEPFLKGNAEEEALYRLERERENVRAAWHWATQNSEIDPMQQAMEALGIFYNRPGYWEEGEGLMASALAGLGDSVDPPSSLLRAWLRAWHGVFRHRIGQVDLARRQLTAVLEDLPDDSLHTKGYRRLQAFVYLHRGGELMTNRQRSETGGDLRQALAIFQEISDDWWTIHSLSILSHWEIFKGHLRQGWERSREAVQLAHRLGYRSGEVIALGLMSFAAEQRGQTETGERLAREAVALYRSPTQRIRVMNRLTFVLLAVGKFEESVTLATETIAWVERIGVHAREIAFLYNTLARGYLHLGRFDEGRSVAEKTVAIWRDAYGWEQPFLLRSLARARLVMGEEIEARRLMQLTVESQQAMGNENLFPLAGALVDCAYPALALGDLNDARRTLVEGLRLAQRSEAFQFTCQALPTLGLLLAEQKRLEEAAFVNGAIQRYPYLTDSRWYATVALDRLTELLAPLPADIRAAAEERGNQHTLEPFTGELLEILIRG